MNNNTAASTGAPDFQGLVTEYLGLDPAALMTMDPRKASVGRGLHEFMRRTLDWALAASFAPDGASFRLHSEASRKALKRGGWPDVQTYNLSCLFAYTLVRGIRHIQHRPYLPLCQAPADVVSLPQIPRLGQTASTSALVAAAVRHFKVDIRLSGPGAIQPLSLGDRIQKQLRLSPAILLRSYYDDVQTQKHAFISDPEGQSINGLAALLTHTISNYQHGLASDFAIRIPITNDADHGGLANARYSNVINVLLAGLYADSDHDVAFLS